MLAVPQFERKNTPDSFSEECSFLLTLFCEKKIQELSSDISALARPRVIQNFSHHRTERRLLL